MERYEITHAYTDESLATIEAENALDAISRYAEGQGFARYEDLPVEEGDGSSWFHFDEEQDEATGIFTNYEIRARRVRDDSQLGPPTMGDHEDAERRAVAYNARRVEVSARAATQAAERATRIAAEEFGVSVVEPAGWVTREGYGPFATKEDAIAASIEPLPATVEHDLDDIAEQALQAAFAVIAARLGRLGYPVTGDFAPDETLRLGIEFRRYVRRMAQNNDYIAGLADIASVRRGEGVN